jgi:insulysin
MDIIKPKFDLRNYTGGKLINNIKYVVISDDTLDRTYISVNIKAGSYNEPQGYDGLAHFLEHMLFMGSEKYPKESYFADIVAKFSGFQNAYTDSRETCYYLGCDNDGYDQIIDIFSRFFIDPLFLKDSIDREINAVNNEHLKNINDDNWILNQFIRNISSNKNIFMTGNYETLNKKDIREKMIEFYKKYYITQNISICIATNININKIINSLNNTFGIIIPDTNNQQNTGIIFKEKGSFYLKSIRDINKLVFIWEIPEQINSEQYKTHQFNILGNLLTVNIDNSLKFYLKNNGFINNFSYDVGLEGYFMLYFDLTPNGINNINLIETLLNNYLELIYQMDFDKVVDYYNKLNMINFNYLNKIDTLALCIHMSSNAHYYELNQVYIGSTIIKKTDDYIDLYKKYINPQNQIKILIKRNYNTDALIKLPYYNSSYTKIKLENYGSDNKYNTLKVLELFNKYIDINPKIYPNLDKYKIPRKINNYWYGGLSQFNEPIIYFTINITNDNYYKTPRNYLLTIISCSILNYLLSLKFFQAFSIGFSASFHSSSNLSSIIISGNGLSDKKIFNIFIEEIIDFIKQIKNNIIISNNYIESIITAIHKSIQNNIFSNPVQYNNYIIDLLTNPNQFSDDILLEEIKNVNSNMVREYIDNLFITQSYITNIFYGSLKKLKNTDQLNFIKNNDNIILPKIKPFWLCNAEICPINNNKLIIDHPDKNQKSSSIMFYYNIGQFIPKDILLLYMINDLLSDKFFDELRTKKQLGYLVSMKSSNIMNNYALVQQIQSDKPIDNIIEEIESFNKNIFSFIKESEISEYKIRIKNTLKIKDNNTAEVFNRYSSEIINRTYLFNRKEILLQQIKNITFNDLKNFIERIINNNNCIKIIIKGH